MILLRGDIRNENLGKNGAAIAISTPSILVRCLKPVPKLPIANENITTIANTINIKGLAPELLQIAPLLFHM